MTKTKANWDLGDLYKGMNDPAIKADFRKADDFISKLKSYRGKISQLSPKEVRELIEAEETLGFLFHKIGLFAGLLESTNVADPEVTRFVKQLEETLVMKSQELLFIAVEFSQLLDKSWQIVLKAPELQDYRQHLTELYHEAKHTLSEPEEKIMAEKSQTSSGALGHLYSITTNTLEFDWDKKTVTLDELLIKFHDESAAIRKKTALVLHEGLNKNKLTTPAIYNALVQDKAISDRLRKFEHPEDSRFLHDNVDRDTVEAMVASVKSAFPLVARYYNLKKKIFDVKTLGWWDRYAPLPATTTKITQDEAKVMVEQAYHQFSPELSAIVKDMYDKEHIDWLPKANKQGGAFCAFGGKDIYPFVLLNYTDTPRDVMTLAHELGHAVHDVLAQENNVFVQTHPSLAVAEIASVFGESLLFDHLMASNLPERDKLALLMSSIEDTFATVFRQVTMFLFEQKIHTERKKRGELSREEIDTMWDETIRQPFGDSLVFSPEHQNTWMYIPHIINTPFYVYSYAFAQLCVLALVQSYQEEGKKFVPKYLKLLKAGGSLTPRDNLAQAGFDITKPEFWKKGTDRIKKSIDTLEELVEEANAAYPRSH